MQCSHQLLCFADEESCVPQRRAAGAHVHAAIPATLPGRVRTQSTHHPCSSFCTCALHHTHVMLHKLRLRA